MFVFTLLRQLYLLNAHIEACAKEAKQMRADDRHYSQTPKKDSLGS